ncbi:hypothetical protein L3X38_025945 [Prunus dulcis]|uniref:Retrotransposon gag domain-containing protein n=1 Tax=Prunus dulcis TaxID=3755 RepID=A0AAD4Z7V9_PRUDU|nr:hypothetical protein L3X38_025945 [Prunus dulcis]
MTGTTSSIDQLVELEPEIEQKLRAIHRRQRQDREKKNQQGEEEMALVPNEIVGDLDIPTIPTSLSSIILLAARNYELKNIHFNMMSFFHGLSSEDPLAHIRDILNMVSNMALTGGVTEEHLRMKVFPHTVKDKAKTWLNSLRPGLLTSWMEVQNKFLEKFFLIQKTDALRDKIMQFSQQVDESFSEAWERFNNFLIQCPYHGLSTLLLVRIFYKASATFWLGSKTKSDSPRCGGSIGLDIVWYFEKFSSQDIQVTYCVAIHYVLKCFPYRPDCDGMLGFEFGYCMTVERILCPIGDIWVRWVWTVGSVPTSNMSFLMSLRSCKNSRI